MMFITAETYCETNKRSVKKLLVPVNKQKPQQKIALQFSCV